MALMGRYYPRATASTTIDMSEAQPIVSCNHSLNKTQIHLMMMFLTFKHATHKSNIFETMCN